PKRIELALAGCFFLLIVVGLAWLGAAFHDLRFHYALAAWDLLALIAWCIELATLPSAKQISLTRRWTDASALSVPGTITLILENSGRIPVYAKIVDNVPACLCFEDPELDVKCAAHIDESV